ncbi:MAG: rRNA maturation RNase YbeY [Verrucomicrobiales bacterium]
MKVRIDLVNRQEVRDLPEALLRDLRAALQEVADLLAAEGKGVLPELEEVVVSLVDDVDMARVHGEFMADPTTTDVITFEHGELLLGVEVAERQGPEYGNSCERELFLYGIHGLLHLAAYDDIREEDREKMWARQEKILSDYAENWPSFRQM